MQVEHIGVESSDGKPEPGLHVNMLHELLDVAPVVVVFPSPVYGLSEGHFVHVTPFPPGE